MRLLREQVRAELKQLFKQQHKPVVYVTHDQTEAMTLSSRVAVLYQGVVQQLAPPHRIYSHPANQFVAGFIGSPQMNLLNLPCRDNAAVLGNFKIPLPKLPTIPPQIVLGIRPEDVCFEGEGKIEGKVYLVEELGKEKLISVKIGGSELTVRSLCPANQRFGERLALTFPQDLIHWFDPQSGDRLNIN